MVWHAEQSPSNAIADVAIAKDKSMIAPNTKPFFIFFLLFLAWK
jgi:hypothetical protein